MLNLDSLKVFLAVAEHDSFSEAGRQLHLSQQQSVRSFKLGTPTGAQLFIRQSRTVQLTEAGKCCPMARELLTSAQRVEQTILSVQGEVIGEMTVAAPRRQVNTCCQA